MKSVSPYNWNFFSIFAEELMPTPLLPMYIYSVIMLIYNILDIIGCGLM